MKRFRDEADVLFVPMSFDGADKANMEISFPSKLTDYTVVGIPLLIYGPAYCSAVRWARENDGVAEVVDEQSIDALTKAVMHLSTLAPLRMRLGERALEIGRQFFSYEAVITRFHQIMLSANNAALC
jgi:hypothetical protein